MSGKAHPSDALLATFGHDAIEVEFSASPQAGHSRIAAVGVGMLLAALTAGMTATMLSEGAVGAAMILVPFMCAVFVIAQLIVAWQARAIRLVLRPDKITLVVRAAGRIVRQRDIALSDVRATHGVVTNQFGTQSRGLRLALVGDEELLLAAPSVPMESLEWLAAEIRGVAHTAAGVDDADVPPELVALLSGDAKARVEAADRARRAASARAATKG